MIITILIPYVLFTKLPFLSSILYRWKTFQLLSFARALNVTVLTMIKRSTVSAVMNILIWEWERRWCGSTKLRLIYELPFDPSSRPLYVADDLPCRWHHAAGEVAGRESSHRMSISDERFSRIRKSLSDSSSISWKPMTCVASSFPWSGRHLQQFDRALILPLIVAGILLYFL